MTDLYQHKGKVVTDLYCTHCSKNFRAKLDHDIDGNHIIECPWCGHEHCRVIKDGRVMGDGSGVGNDGTGRWAGRAQRPNVVVNGRNVWKSSVIQATSTSASQFLRDAWLARKGGR